jgi:hypothetical protein
MVVVQLHFFLQLEKLQTMAITATAISNFFIVSA